MLPVSGAEQLVASDSSGDVAHHLAQRRVVEVRELGAVVALGQEEVPEVALARFDLQLLHHRRREVRVARLGALRRGRRSRRAARSRRRTRRACAFSSSDRALGAKSIVGSYAFAVAVKNSTSGSVRLSSGIDAASSASRLGAVVVGELARRRAELHGDAVGVVGVDRGAPAVVDAHAVEAVVEPALELELEIVDGRASRTRCGSPTAAARARWRSRCWYRRVEHRRRGCPRPRASRRCRCRRRGAGPSRSRRASVGLGFDLHELEAHCLRVEAVGRVEVLGGDCYVVKRHGPSLARCRIMDPAAGRRVRRRRSASRSATGSPARTTRSSPRVAARRVRLQAGDDGRARRRGGRAAIPAAGADARRPWFVAALVFSLAGDVLLMLPREQFVAGLAAFLVAHLCYIVGFWTDGPALVPFLVAAVIVGARRSGRSARRILPGVRRQDPALVAPGRCVHGGDRGDGRDRRWPSGTRSRPWAPCSSPPPTR